MDQDTNTPKDHTHTTEQTTKRDPSVKLMEPTSKLVNILLNIKKKSKPTVDFMEQLALGNRLCCSNLHKESFVDAVRTAGGGEAFLDTCMYLKGWREDTEAYVALYGLEPEKVFELREKDVSYAIWALDNHVNLVIDEEKEVSVEVEEKYQAFLGELQRTEHFPRYPKNDPETPLGKVWLEYMKAAGHRILWCLVVLVVCKLFF